MRALPGYVSPQGAVPLGHPSLQQPGQQMNIFICNIFKIFSSIRELRRTEDWDGWGLLVLFGRERDLTRERCSQACLSLVEIFQGCVLIGWIMKANLMP